MLKTSDVGRSLQGFWLGFWLELCLDRLLAQRRSCVGGENAILSMNEVLF
jgi:hypothetical protein